MLPHSAFFFIFIILFFSFSLDLLPRAEKAKRSSPARTTFPARPSLQENRDMADIDLLFFLDQQYIVACELKQWNVVSISQAN